MKHAVDVWDATGNKITVKASATWEEVLAAMWQMNPDQDVYMRTHRRPARVSRMHAAYRARHR